jgi:hypothetical protein
MADVWALVPTRQHLATHIPAAQHSMAQRDKHDTRRCQAQAALQATHIHTAHAHSTGSHKHTQHTHTCIPKHPRTCRRMCCCHSVASGSPCHRSRTHPPEGGRVGRGPGGTAAGMHVYKTWAVTCIQSTTWGALNSRQMPRERQWDAQQQVRVAAGIGQRPGYTRDSNTGI